MATPAFPRFSRERDQAAAHALVEELMSLIPKPRGRNRGIRRTTFQVDIDGNALEHPISSWHFTEFLYKKSPCPFPTLARGLFTRSMTAAADTSPRYDIVARGYDKFFNVGEVPKTQDAWLRANTCGPYELTVKENGCLILVAALTPSRVLVTSKHSLGIPNAEGQDANGQPTHAQVGRQWLFRHLQTARKTENDLAAFLHRHNVTAVFELCDDEFEEHILAYQGSRRGLYLHGVNRNTPELHTWPSALVTYAAEAFGFHRTGFYTCDTYDKAAAFADRIRQDQALEGRAVEGFVVRCLLTNHEQRSGSGPHSYQDDHSQVHMYKVKYDDPYLLYREWRELTKRIICQRPFRTQHKLSEHYAKWVRSYLAKDPSLAPAFQRNQGIIEARNQFLRYWENQGHSLAQDLHEASASAQRKTVLVPIATIGCGKTTLANALVHLYGFGHVQNDNINVRRNGAQAFHTQVLNALVSHNVVIADRNNHLAQHRQGLTTDVSEQFLNCRFIALYWNVDQLDSEKVFRQMAVRVRQRGENHQSLTPSRTQNFEHVIWSFIRSFQPPDPDATADHLLED
ncbi:trna ligase, partial [Dimargaris verticillata]